MPPSRLETKTASSDPRETTLFTPDADSVFQEGNSVSGFLLQKQLGQGGMGAVFAAVDEGLGRRVALKVMRRDIVANPTRRGRFLREAKVTASLEHDNIVRVYHVGEADGQPFLVMELLSGQSLRARLKHGEKPTLTQGLRITRDVARGLAAAHARQLVHRDVSPGNIWLEPTGRAKLLDFGLVHDPDPNPDAARLTLPGAVLGTPGFMSPEQAAGMTTDHRSDLFSLGCVLYLLVTGADPFPGHSSSERMTAVQREHPPAPKQMNPGVPSAVSRLIGDLLAKLPEDRPRTAWEVADRVSGLMAEYGTPEAKPSAPQRWHPAAAHALTAGLTLVLTAALFYLLLAVGVLK
jgi:serine/threonine protein kinase